MSQSTINIERVVREVLAELGVAPLPASIAPAPIPAPPPAPPARPAVSENELVVTSRVVTMVDILGRLNGARRLVVAPDAIVTPAVRDELLRRGVALAHADSCGGRPVESTRLVIMTAGTAFDSAALAAGLARDKLLVERCESECLVAAVDQLAAEIAGGDTLCVLLTPHTAAGLCLANRLRGVRAVTGSDAPAVATASAAVGANLLVVDPLAGTFFQAKQIVAEFCRCRARPCPEVFQTRLT